MESVAAFRINEELKNKIVALAKAYDMTVSDFLRAIVEEKVTGKVTIPGKLVDVDRKLGLLLIITGTILERMPFIYQSLRATHEALLSLPLPSESRRKLEEIIRLEREAEETLRNYLEVLAPILRREEA